MESANTSRTDVSIRGGRPAGTGKRTGTVVDQRFELISPLGAGSMSEVYEAKHRGFDDLVALKILHLPGPRDRIAENRFFKEAHALFTLNHPNIVRVFDTGRSVEGDCFLAMELLHGETLADFIDGTTERDETYLKTVVDYLLGACSALKAAHALGVVHGELNPSGILLSENAATDEIIPKILDFGSAPISDDGKSVSDNVPRSSPYLSPEQRAGNVVDARSDIYAMGVLLYEALTGELPVRGKDTATELDRPTEEAAIPEPSLLNYQISSTLDGICLKALAVDPDDRFQTMDAFVQALNRTWTRGVIEDTSGPMKWGMGLVFTALLASFAASGATWYFMERGGERNVSSVSEHTQRSTNPPIHGGSQVNTRAESIELEVVTTPRSVAPDSVLTGSDGIEEEKKIGAIEIVPEPKPDVDRKPVSANNEHDRSDTPSEARIEAQDEQVDALLDEGRKALRARDYTRAEESFEKVLEIDAASPEAWAGLSKITFQSGEYARAAEQMKRALSGSDRPEWRISLGSFLLRSGERARALETWRSVEHRYPGSPKAIETARKLLSDNADR